MLTCSGIIVVRPSLPLSTPTHSPSAQFITQRGSLWSMALEFIVTSVHINSMLGALNCRENLRGKTDGTSAESHGLASRLSSRLWRPSALASSPSRFGASGTTGSGWSQDVSFLIMEKVGSVLMGVRVPVDASSVRTWDSCDGNEREFH